MKNGERQRGVVCHSPSAQVNRVRCPVAEFVTVPDAPASASWGIRYILYTALRRLQI